MLIGLDIGNSNTLTGIFLTGSKTPDYTFNFDTDSSAQAETLYETIIKKLDTLPESARKPEAFVFSSVVRELNEKYKTVSESLFKVPVVQVSHLSKLKISIRYDDPSTLGPDRITNAEAAFVEYGGGIVVDIGTALTVCAIDSDGVYLGGIISPGPGTAARALALSTSLLPAITIEKTVKVTADNTIDAIRSGIYNGWAAMINGLVEKIKQENRITSKTVLTGGFGTLFRKDIIHDIHDPMLTMKGLKIIYDGNI